MYETKVFYNENGYDLKELLKSCIVNYYKSEKKDLLNKNDLQNEKKHRIMRTTNKYEILSKKGVKHV